MFWPAPSCARALELMEKGRVGRAEKIVNGVLAKRPDDQDAWMLLAAMLTHEGRFHDVVKRIAAPAKKKWTVGPTLAYLMSKAHSALGDKKRGVEWLFVAAQDPEVREAMKRDPHVATLADEPRVARTLGMESYGYA